ncbi:CcoQ/FixQ family Cbb3-type cytochrome c oxidase assembly chaperone [Bacteroides fragilis]|jgi:hypothetical protein|nr:Uncharacterised protein [Bacteroides fragilis NCTC 9343]
METLVAYLIFLILFWAYTAFELKNAPTDVELWGEEVE